MEREYEKKRILMFSRLNVWSMAENKGAPSFYRTIKGYVEDNWDLTLVAPKTNSHRDTDMKMNSIVFKPLFASFLKIPRLGFLLTLLNIRYAEKRFYKIGKKILKRDNKGVVLYAYEVHGVKAAKRLSSEFNIPLITRFQGTVLAPVENSLLNRIKHYPHFSALKTSADAVIMTNDGTQGDRVLKNLGNTTSNVFFWRNGIDVEFLNSTNSEDVVQLRKVLGLSDNDKVIVTVSRLVGWKRVDRAIDAFYHLNKLIKNVKLIIVGDGVEKQSLIDYTQNLGLSSNVLFVGAIDHNEVKIYMSMADIFMSLYDLSNVGNPLLEAMAVGKAIVTLNVGDTGDLIQHEKNGILINIEQLHAIPEYLRKLCEDDDYAKYLGGNAKQYADRNFWSWEERILAEVSMAEELIIDKK